MMWVKIIFKIPRALFLILYFLWEVVLANVRVAICVLSPLRNLKPGFVAIPLAAKTDAEITFLANMITLTPGTLTVDVSDDRKTLYIHSIFAEDPKAVRDQIKHNFERRLLRVTR